MIKAILFDFFDVFRSDAYKAWLATNKIPHEGNYFDASYQQDIGTITNEQFFERLSELQGRPITRDELDADAWVDEAMIALAEQLRDKYKTALISNAPSARIRELLRQHDLERLFDEIIVSSEVSMVKPSKEIFHLTLKRLGVKKSEAVFIDDNKGHTDAARALGIRSIQFISAAQARQALADLGVRFQKHPEQ